MDKRHKLYDVIVVGGGPTGIGVGVALQDAGIEKFAILERETIGASFDAWPKETRFITPSFPTNSIGMLDLNAIAIGSSPAVSLGVEHPTGQEYAAYLRAVAHFFEVPVHQDIDVTRIVKDDHFLVETADGEIFRTKRVIWAAGEFQYPRLNGFPGSELCTHTATIPSYGRLLGEEFIIIGGYESGVDAAYHLAQRGKKVRLFDAGCPWKEESTDPSISLSTYSLERMRSDIFRKYVKLFPNSPVKEVAQKRVLHEVTTADGSRFTTRVPPLLAHGFQGSHGLVAHLFDKRDDGFPLLSETDESTIVPGIYLCGPTVRHDEQIFCFIYKYRQRFAVVVKAIASSLGFAAEGLVETYRANGMYLDDLSCCGDECVC
ncbi:MAG: NAD(P)/FAD-dependent oxidoreductase [Myxococcota bacterium]